MNAKLSEALLRLRSQHGLTQEEVAHHLGITKAAVSKWECCQSMPDITLLPAIADLYSTTIDALFDREEDLSLECINEIYLEAMNLLGKDYEAGLDYIQEQAREHWTNYPFVHMMSLALFSQIPQLPGFDENGLSGQALECARETERLARNAMELTSSEEGSVADLPVLSRVLLWTGRVVEAEALIESRVRKEPDLSAATLAQLYKESRRDDQAVTVLQRTILIALLEAESAIMALSPSVDELALSELAELASALQKNEAYISIFPTLMPTIRLQQAKCFISSGEETLAMGSLDAFARDLDRACSVMANPTYPHIFDKVTEMLWSDATQGVASARAEAISKLRESYAASLESNECWSAVGDRTRFSRFVEHVRTGDEGGE